ncbi:unnamed protein product [Lymnaea stagnalis]|uniref:WW domain-containing protein n=1 Tax=Lymnaea stagnalis TaxID=6523 RepID=A0AAV2H7M0_LYMST
MSRRGGKRKPVLQLGNSSSQLHRYGYSKEFHSKDKKGRVSALALVGSYSDSDSNENSESDDQQQVTETGEQVANELTEQNFEEASVVVPADVNMPSHDTTVQPSDMDDELKNFLSEIEAIPVPNDLISGNANITPSQPTAVKDLDTVAENISVSSASSSSGKSKINPYSMFVKGAVEFIQSTNQNVTNDDSGDHGKKKLEEENLPEEPTTSWQMVQDEHTQYYYYWNMETNRVTWEIPTEYTQFLLLHQEYEEKVSKLSAEQLQALKDKKANKKSLESVVTEKETIKKSRLEPKSNVSQHPPADLPKQAAGDLPSTNLVPPVAPDKSTHLQLDTDRRRKHKKEKKTHHKKKHKRKHSDSYSEGESDDLKQSLLVPDIGPVKTRDRSALSALARIVPYLSDQDGEDSEDNENSGQGAKSSLTKVAKTFLPEVEELLRDVDNIVPDTKPVLAANTAQLQLGQNEESKVLTAGDEVKNRFVLPPPPPFRDENITKDSNEPTCHEDDKYKAGDLVVGSIIQEVADESIVRSASSGDIISVSVNESPVADNVEGVTELVGLGQEQTKMEDLKNLESPELEKTVVKKIKPETREVIDMFAEDAPVKKSQSNESLQTLDLKMASETVSKDVRNKERSKDKVMEAVDKCPTTEKIKARMQLKDDKYSLKKGKTAQVVSKPVNLNNITKDEAMEEGEIAESVKTAHGTKVKADKSSHQSHGVKEKESLTKRSKDTRTSRENNTHPSREKVTHNHRDKDSHNHRDKDSHNHRDKDSHSSRDSHTSSQIKDREKDTQVSKEKDKMDSDRRKVINIVGYMSDGDDGEEGEVFDEKEEEEVKEKKKHEEVKSSSKKKKKDKKKDSRRRSKDKKSDQPSYQTLFDGKLDKEIISKVSDTLDQAISDIVSKTVCKIPSDTISDLPLKAIGKTSGHVISELTAKTECIVSSPALESSETKPAVDDVGEIDFDDLDDIDRALEVALEKKLEQKKVELSKYEDGDDEKMPPPEEQNTAHSLPETAESVSLSLESDMNISNCDKMATTESGPLGTVLPDDDKFKEEVKNVAELALNKLEFLDISTENLSRLQVLFIELQTRHTDWIAGGLSIEYFYQQLKVAEGLLEQYELSAVPEGWACQWDRANNRYYYRNKTTNRIQWEYPEVEGGDKAGEKTAATETEVVSAKVRENVVETDEQRKQRNSRSSRHRKRDEKERSKYDKRSSSHRYRRKRRRRRDHSSSSESSEESRQDRHHHKSKKKKRHRSERSPSVEIVEDSVEILKLENSTPAPPATNFETTVASSPHIQVAFSTPPPPPEGYTDDATTMQDMEESADETTVEDFSYNVDGISDAITQDIYSREDNPLSMSSTAVISKPPQIVLPQVSATPLSDPFLASAEFPLQQIVTSSQPTQYASQPAPSLTQSMIESACESVEGSNESDKQTKKKKKEKKTLATGSSIMMKKKHMTSMVQKWQKVKKEVEKEDRAKELRQAAIRKKIEELK